MFAYETYPASILHGRHEKAFSFQKTYISCIEEKHDVLIPVACYFETARHLLEPILCGQAAVPKIAMFCGPVLQTAVIKHLHIVRDNKGNDAIPQALFE